MSTNKTRQPAGRLIARPARVERCAACAAALGFNYCDCPPCQDSIERFWEADWAALLGREGIAAGSDDEDLLARLVAADLDDYPWTIVDMALRRLRCDECAGELAGGEPGCPTCEFTFGNLWWHDFEAGEQGAMTMNEHALRVGRYVIRHPHRYSAATFAGWRMTMPRVAAGWLPDGAEARRWATRLKNGDPVDWDAHFAAIDAEINRGG
ncbi:MAG TPA: hypothetical protein VD886_18855 [Herpetosiphonaceae bacterium]|nr:hypothetical protein [Herpetosiphonaceae bacterium]